MKYFVDYQQMAKGAARPNDDGEIVGIEMDDKAGFILLPNVGDFVSVDNGKAASERTPAFTPWSTWRPSSYFPQK
jgi:hypothetical protein